MSSNAYAVLGDREKVRLLSQISPLEELRNPQSNAFPWKDKREKENPKEVYKKLISGEYQIAPPELTKTNKTKIAKCWTCGFMLIVERSYYYDI